MIRSAAMFTVLTLLLPTGCDDAAAAEPEAVLDDSQDASDVQRADPDADSSVERPSDPSPLARPERIEDESKPSAAPSCGNHYPTSCYWAANGASLGNGTWLYKATCDSGYHVFAGGCYSEQGSTRVIRSNPFEDNDSTDLPENDECAHSTAGVNGWACEWAQSATGALYARALCCITSY